MALKIPAMLFGALIPYRGRDILVTVRNWTTADDAGCMFWHRTFLFPGDRRALFASRMVCVGTNEIIEYVRFGLGIHMRVFADQGSL